MPGKLLAGRLSEAANAKKHVNATHNNPTSIVKRSADVLIAAAALVFLSPLLIAIAFLIKATDGGPALFKQERIGLGGKTFRCLKFRSMSVNAAEELRQYLANNEDAAREWAMDQKLRHDPRVTAVGRFIRKTSIDELPQLINILAGHMSIVGPRPIVESEISKYGEYFKYYTAVKPGVTGLWQISGRNDTTYKERVLLDVEYAKSWSILLDARIFLLTIPAVLLSKGAY